MSLVHCRDCKKDFIWATTLINNENIKCEYCHGTYIEICIYDDFAKNTVDTGEIVYILKQEYNNIMNIWDEDSKEIINSVTFDQTDESHVKNIDSREAIWNNILGYILDSDGEVIDNILKIIQTIDPDRHNKKYRTDENAKLICLRNHKHIFVIAVLDLLHQEMKIPIGPIPASKDFIKKISKFRLKSDDIKNMSEEKCAVCLMKFENGKTCMKLPCTHMYHSRCIKPWLKKNNTCPNCRSKLPTDNRDYNMYHKISAQFKIPRDVTNYNG